MIEVIKTPHEEVKKYYEEDRVSQSYLKKFDGDPREINEEASYSNAEHFVLGQIVDTFLTGEEGDFQKEFYILELEKTPSDAVIKIVQNIIVFVKEDYEEYKKTCFTPVEEAQVLGQNTQEAEEINKQNEDFLVSFEVFAGELSEKETYLLTSAREAKWNSNWGDTAIFNNIVKEASDYYRAIVKAEGKRVISRTLYDRAITVVESIKTNPRTSAIYNNTDVFDVHDTLDFTIYYQKIIFFEIDEIKCKMMADRLVVFKNRETQKPIFAVGQDYKTMSGNTLDFPNSAKAFRYDIQGAFYRTGISKAFDIPESAVGFEFIVESTTSPGKPIVFTASNEMLENGKVGYMGYTKKIKGYLDYLEDYKFYTLNGFEEEQIIKEAKGYPLVITGDFSLSLPKTIKLVNDESNKW